MAVWVLRRRQDQQVARVLKGVRLFFVTGSLLHYIPPQSQRPVSSVAVGRNAVAVRHLPKLQCLLKGPPVTLHAPHIGQAVPGHFQQDIVSHPAAGGVPQQVVSRLPLLCPDLSPGILILRRSPSPLQLVQHLPQGPLWVFPELNLVSIGHHLGPVHLALKERARVEPRVDEDLGRPKGQAVEDSAAEDVPACQVECKPAAPDVSLAKGLPILSSP
eukprot:CAMPEP_0117670132 /NCGR_PEP_ID=MMETSP0804-20121206/12565_1 /TAXON_ID=1074897 /ORGANISM="Tetraselmis astigmatica, Strain CCMP880" /LENGTH=215 /DNA_ID=CAMNT_0005478361 /DNA_START=469 /DNA_END=1117 /DNA_ORIENTATION=-